MPPPPPSPLTAAGVDWTNWKPGRPDDSARLLADGHGAGLRALLRRAAPPVRELFAQFDNDQLDRLSNACAHCAAHGLGGDEVGRTIRDVVPDPRTSTTVALTVLGLATHASDLSDMRRDEFDWAEVQTAGDDGVCEVCRSYEAHGPYRLRDLPPLPAHPGCGCQALPALDNDSR